ncbi:hypothetical protein COS50_02215 [Candidatus Roizmanbacteria bacterium CG03_land_8_20_14_0_80_35_26]|uniref:Uncharacterized protein n=3 Tax=Candidatus Roizmaniibacteriota TaxID=1752723 RepID=A0A2M7BWZ2_9BACT|nr:MAG: hypothetical protein COV86_04175 [Candidatus Roizmanbacteria bacterium CG11_big_fil_rev_8_21_14_0_20_35_14]PIV11060.1 MAG: hypothetical protein COS50_02215 [Candidatus Roizmanbacteria bacterium CG03_land_8_20_14_0_80_35_26]PJC32184.1 MAG: hypothetical protein CO049_03385 [Candidatus Roizmanbacteria bacterium CG_4_9_14_0_2_um_filter_36_12]
MLNLLPFFTVHAQGIQEWCSNPSDPNCCIVDGVPTLKCFEVVFGNILFMASAFVVLVLFIMFVVGAFRYLTSFGNAEKVKKAQGTLKYALIGFILFISAYLILNIIDIIFLGGKGNIFKFNLGTP